MGAFEVEEAFAEVAGGVLVFALRELADPGDGAEAGDIALSVAVDGFGFAGHGEVGLVGVAGAPAEEAWWLLLGGEGAVEEFCDGGDEDHRSLRSQPSLYT